MADSSRATNTHHQAKEEGTGRNNSTTTIKMATSTSQACSQMGGEGIPPKQNSWWNNREKNRSGRQNPFRSSCRGGIENRNRWNERRRHTRKPKKRRKKKNEKKPSSIDRGNTKLSCMGKDPVQGRTIYRFPVKRCWSLDQRKSQRKDQKLWTQFSRNQRKKDIHTSPSLQQGVEGKGERERERQ